MLQTALFPRRFVKTMFVEAFKPRNFYIFTPCSEE